MKKESEAAEQSYYAPLLFLFFVLLSSGIATVWYVTLYFGPLLPSGAYLHTNTHEWDNVAYAVPVLAAIVAQYKNRKTNSDLPSSTILNQLSPVAFGIIVSVFGVGLSAIFTASVKTLIYVGAAMAVAPLLLAFGISRRSRRGP